MRADCDSSMEGRCLKQALAVLLMFFAVGETCANGSMWETPHRASGNVLLPSGRFTLQHEELDIRLAATDYEAKLTYVLNDAGGKRNSAAAFMYFPVICSQPVGQGESSRCIKKFQAHVDGQLVRSEMLLSSEVIKSKSLFLQATRLNARMQSNGVVSDVQSELPSHYAYYKVKLPSEEVKSLTIEYKAAYAQEVGGSSKQASTYYGPARMVYDFSPAATWAGHDVSELQIRVDITAMQSALAFDKKHWPFVFQGNMGSLTLRDPDLAKLPPLELTTNSAGFQEFVSFMTFLKQTQTRYQGSVLEAKPGQSGHNDVAALFDRDPATFWCWQGKSATLSLRLPLEALKSIGGAKGVPESYERANLWSLGWLNGAVQNKNTFEQFGMAKRISLQAKPPFAEGNFQIRPDRQFDRLPLSVMKSEQDRFRSHWLSEGPLVMALAAEHEVIPESKAAAVQYRKNIKPIEFILKIEDVHPRKDSDESCISEIYPVYSGA